MTSHIPDNPAIMYSWINMQLRDNYASLDELCDDFDISREEIEGKMRANGYTYIPEINQFR